MKKRNLSKVTPFDFISYVVIALIVTLISLGIIANISGLTILEKEIELIVNYEASTLIFYTSFNKKLYA